MNEMCANNSALYVSVSLTKMTLQDKRIHTLA